MHGQLSIVHVEIDPPRISHIFRQIFGKILNLKKSTLNLKFHFFSHEKTKFKQLYTPLALPGWWWPWMPSTLSEPSHLLDLEVQASPDTF